jgi:hypothetical protein
MWSAIKALTKTVNSWTGGAQPQGLGEAVLPSDYPAASTYRPIPAPLSGSRSGSVLSYVGEDHPEEDFILRKISLWIWLFPR